MAEHAGVPVVNALTDDFHPCQLLADLLTSASTRASSPACTVAFVGDGACNMGNSWLLAGATAGMHVRVSAPDGLRARRRRWSTRADGDRRRRPAARRPASPTRSRPSPAPTSSSPTPGSRWARRTRPRARAAVFAPYSLDAGAARARQARRDRACTACRPTAARRSPPRSSTARRAWSGTRPRTGGTPRRRS